MQFPAEIILQERKFILEGEKFDKTGNYLLHYQALRRRLTTKVSRKAYDKSQSKMRGFFNNGHHSRNDYIPGYIMPSKKMLIVSYGTVAKTRRKDF